MGEMADAENFFGVEWGQPERSGMRITAAFLWIALKRKDPTVTVDDIRNLDPAVLQQLETGGDTNPPTAATPGSSEPSEPTSSGSSAGSEPDPSPTGLPGSANGSDSDRVTSPV